ncbi:MAG: adenosylmethionine decarboxylase [Candidatus Micrarchaeaceae archaeon]
MQKSKNTEVIIGKHVFGNMFDISPKLISNLEFIYNAVVSAASIGNMHIIKIISKKFKVKGSGENGGVSVIALIIESHISVHTWPESGYATVDIYSCGEEADPNKAFSYLVKVLKPKYFKKYFADRSNK